MSAKKSINRFLELRAQYPDSYAIWHCRIATHGVKNEGNCHPFKVGDSSLTYLAHNGMLDLPMKPDDRRSDSRVFAEEVLPLIGGVSALDDDRVWTMIESWATGSKMAILTLDPKAKSNLYIINEKAGSWDTDGIWWSNTYHRPAPVYDSYRYHPKPSQYDSGWCDSGWGYDYRPPKESKGILTSVPLDDTLELLGNDDWEGFLCPNCNNIVEGNDLESEYCPVCRGCYECGDVAGFCMCYTPAETSKANKNYYQEIPDSMLY